MQSPSPSRTRQQAKSAQHRPKKRNILGARSAGEKNMKKRCHYTGDTSRSRWDVSLVNQPDTFGRKPHQRNDRYGNLKSGRGCFGKSAKPAAQCLGSPTEYVSCPRCGGASSPLDCRGSASREMLSIRWDVTTSHFRANKLEKNAFNPAQHVMN